MYVFVFGENDYAEEFRSGMDRLLHKQTIGDDEWKIPRGDK